MKHKKRTYIMLFVISILMVIFGTFWTVFTFIYGGNPFVQNKNQMYEWLFILGLIFVILSIIQGVYNIKTLIELKNNKKSNFITENPDNKDINSDIWKNIYCPYCGNGLNSDFLFCNKCGKKLP